MVEREEYRRNRQACSREESDHSATRQRQDYQPGRKKSLAAVFPTTVTPLSAAIAAEGA